MSINNRATDTEEALIDEENYLCCYDCSIFGGNHSM